MVPLHAADTLPVSFSPENPSVTKSTSDQTVTMKLQMDGTQTIEGFLYVIVCDSPIKIDSVTIGSKTMEVSAGNIVENQKEYQVTCLESVTSDHLGAITFTIPAGTDAGMYSIALETREAGGVMIGGETKTVSAQAAIHVIEGGSQTGSYIAELSGVSTATVGDTVELSVTVSGSAFASAAYTLEYDTDRLLLKSVSAGEYSD